MNSKKKSSKDNKNVKNNKAVVEEVKSDTTATSP